MDSHVGPLDSDVDSPRVRCRLAAGSDVDSLWIWNVDLLWTRFIQLLRIQSLDLQWTGSNWNEPWSSQCGTEQSVWDVVRVVLGKPRAHPRFCGLSADGGH